MAVDERQHLALVASTQCLHQATVLRGNRSGAWILAFQACHREPSLDQQRPVHPVKPRTAGGGHERLVETQVHVCHGVPVPRPGSIGHLADQRRQVADGRNVARAQDLPRCLSLDGAPSDTQVIEIAIVQGDDEHPSVGLTDQQALLDQPLEGLANRAPRHAQLFGELGLRELPTGRKGPVDDPGPNGL